jgi:hypothetical protein
MHWFPQILAAFSAVAIGFIWYHPKVFGNTWMQVIGMTEEKAKQSNPLLTFGVTFAVALVLTIPLAYMVNHDPDGLRPCVHGMFHGGLHYGVMVALPVLVTNAMYERRDLKYMLINVGYWVVTMAVMGAILEVMIPSS